ncbi:ABC transporter substrate-binding protein [Chelatococcus reniformis]|uniref:ABC transporter permease n=1 Tax=Chelatococcus reniformis TaxID=1494448 RepID=A0A916UBK0_9HYPH|nr:ABC transporter substrate-binding protein [Chelatococcus reniformis]GGC67004.1 ABC transporter permease [Chelatococcus reniformis]
MSLLKLAASAAVACLFAASVHAQSTGPAISDKVVKIGVLNDQAGPSADVTGIGSLHAARLAVEDFGPTVRGAKIELVVGDHQNKADIGAGIARRWYETEQVDMITDIGNSAVSLAVQALAREQKKIIMHVGSATDRIYGADCSPTGFLWLYDTYAIARAVAKANIALGGDTWYILAADYAFGHSMEGQLKSVVQASGGKVLGSARHPLYGADFSSFVLQAQTSRAKIVALANAGPDTINVIKQGAEFGLTKGGQKLAATTFYITNVHGLGLETAQGLRVVTGFYWDRNDATRAFTERFKKLSGGRVPTQVHAGVYSAVLAYLRAIDAAGTDDGPKVSQQLKAAPVDDMFAEGAKVRSDGRLMNDLFLAEVKAPAESRGPWDYYKIEFRVPAAEIIRPLGEGGCAL